MNNHNWVPKTLPQVEAKLSELHETLFQTNDNLPDWKLTAVYQHLSQAIHIIKTHDRRTT